MESTKHVYTLKRPDEECLPKLVIRDLDAITICYAQQGPTEKIAMMAAGIQANWEAQ